MADALPEASVEGVDVAAGMIARATLHARVVFRVGDATRLSEADGSVDVVSVGYGLRNFPDHRASLAEISRVLRPGGIVAIIEFTRPRWRPWRWFLLGYLWTAGMLFGWLWHRHGPVYGYIAHSIARFVTRRQLVADCAAAGLAMVHEGQALGGGICILVARKPG
jgi:demethylmenaquinone methyltransferase/2-methoxy-6-polyprenyl-1,4-benzoquinol methylase